jgi:hypothetical protein
MKLVFAFIAVSIFLSVTSVVPAQSPSSGARLETRPRLVVTPTPDEPPAPVEVPAQPVVATTSESQVVPASRSNTSLHLSPLAARTRIAEAERLFKSRPRPTSLTTPALDAVTLALFDGSTSRIHLLSVSKQTFLVRNAEQMLTTSLGTPVTLHVLRANGVNTAVTVFDASGRSLTPLLVEFPIERGGVFREMAYYTSAHPALLSADLVKSGQSYVRSMIDLAAERLREKGASISPNIVDVAERLCLVEHVDHERFRNENRKALFDEVYSLYALNQLDTYRYSVSFAGAGGMVQMIPWAYNLERQRHPGVGLTPDFVAGMRNHANALQAMLLYMQDTWNDLAAREDVQYAMNAKLATQTELLAAGYNSNAAKLPLYIRRGGSAWRTLIPRETQVYLQIYRSLDALVPMNPRASAVAQQGRE